MLNEIHGLLIEDNEDHAELISRHVRRLDAETMTLDHVTTLQEGIAELNARRFDCILLDLGLPDSPIAETLPRMHEAAPATPIIVLTSIGDLEAATDAVRRGAQEYLVKSEITGELLLRAVRYGIERKKISVALEKQRLALERSNDALRHFAHLVAHELKQPLNPILMNCALVRRRLGNVDETVDKCLGRVESSVRDMAGLVDQMLEFARVEREAAPLVPVDLQRIVRAVLHELDAQIEACHAEVSVSDMPQVMGSERHLQQTMANLVSNAIKHRSGDRPRIEIVASETERAWRIEVRDNGVGIAEEDQSLIFDMFRRAEGTEHDGHGIGLAYCRRIVEYHGGTLGVDSQLGVGSTFHITLPKNTRSDRGRTARPD